MSCETCWGTGFYKGYGAPCAKGCRPAVAGAMVAAEPLGLWYCTVERTGPDKAIFDIGRTGMKHPDATLGVKILMQPFHIGLEIVPINMYAGARVTFSVLKPFRDLCGEIYALVLGYLNTSILTPMPDATTEHRKSTALEIAKAVSQWIRLLPP